ncbi:competence protein ComEA [Prauserella marina]|uniref:Competence protein ComEA n=2 Tax=Prauserella marina TaxID=530584 RepID=A0A1G6I9M4_9PSEU|nr:competence protein ComEA [Prauserella marina]SDC03194.1 competence protein ComEA [Prauserella marina]
MIERWLPEGALSGPGRRRGVFLATGLVVAAVIVTAVVMLTGSGPASERPPPLPVAQQQAAAVTATTGPSTTDTSDEPMVVSVVGKVAEPGLITVPAGARVADAIRAVGGADKDADLLSVNLARRLSDGEQVYVGVPVPPEVMAAESGPAPPGTGAGQQDTAKIDLNTAGQEQLESLNGVGEVTAQRILDWRARNGRFTAVEQLREVDGIGEKRFAELREQVTLG